jgi:ABC-2 type transport system permease protein
MATLAATEWLKMRKYKAFWWILGLTALSYPGINYMFYYVYKEFTSDKTQFGTYAKMALGNPFSFPEAWHTVAFFSSIFVFIPGVVVIMLITNEYTFRTHRQNIIDGWSRNQFITSKLLDVLIITVFVTLVYATVALVTGINNQERLFRDTWTQVYYVGLFALQTFAQLSLAFLVGFLVRKAFLALGFFLFYSVILENILVQYLLYKKIPVAEYFPLEISDRIIPRPAFLGKIDPEAYTLALNDVPKYILLTILLTTVVWLLIYRINQQKDLR